jgi:hypothetical protein
MACTSQYICYVFAIWRAASYEHMYRTREFISKVFFYIQRLFIPKATILSCISFIPL